MCKGHNKAIKPVETAMDDNNKGQNDDTGEVKEEEGAALDTSLTNY